MTTKIGSGEWWERRKVEDVREGGKKWEKVQGRSKEACWGLLYLLYLDVL